MITQKKPSLLSPVIKHMTLGALLAGSLTGHVQSAITAYTNSGNGVWTVSLNWSNGVPGPGDLAIIGGNVNAENSNLRLNVDATVDAINITDGLHLDTDGNVLSASNVDAPGIPEISISGSNEVDGAARPSRLIVTETNGMVAYDLFGRDVSIDNSGELYFEETADVLISGVLETDNNGAIVGDGAISFSGNNPINNNGIIEVKAGKTLNLLGFNNSNAAFNLDGTTGDGQLDASATGSSLNVGNIISGSQFDGTMKIGRNSSIDLASPLLRMGSNDNPGELVFTGLFGTGGTLTLDSGDGDLVLQRGTQVTVSSGAATIDADLRLSNFTTGITLAKQQLIQATTSLVITGETSLYGGVFEVGGTLNFEGGLGQTGFTSFNLDGGTVEGKSGAILSLDGDNNPRITGHGTWNIGLQNESSIEAAFGDLIINGIGTSIDLDGLDDNGVLRAELGSLMLSNEPALTFHSDIYIGNDNMVSLDMPSSTFTGDSRLIFQGAAKSSKGGTLTTEGQLTVQGEVRVLSPSVIDADTILASTASVELNSDLTIAEGNELALIQGNSFSGTGTLTVPAKSRLEFPTSQVISGSLEIGGKIIGTGNSRSRMRVNGDVTFISGDEPSFWEMSIEGPATNVLVNQQWDRITADGKANLSGTLFVAFDVPQAQKGESWKVLQASEVKGKFDSLQIVGALPDGAKMIQVISQDGVYLKLVDEFTTYAEWEEAQNLPENGDEWHQNPDGDDFNNAAEMYLGGDPMENDSASLQPSGGIVNVDDDDYFTITIRRAHHGELLAVAAIFYQSVDLESWDLINLELHSSVYDANECVSYDTYRMTEPVSSRPKVFLRADFVLP